MSNYVKSTNFAIKDSLVTTDPAKIIKGTEIDNEYNAISNAISSKADTNSPALTGTPTVPTATPGTNTTQIASCAFVLVNGIPSGCIVMWSGSIASIPAGWVLCNGSSGTPDLRDRFVIGAGSNYAVGATGGSKDATLPAHSHSVSDPGHGHGVSDPGHTHSVNYSNAINLDVGGIGALVQLGSTNTSASTTGISIQGAGTGISIASAGSSATNANLPPYYALAYIMKS